MICGKIPVHRKKKRKIPKFIKALGGVGNAIGISGVAGVITFLYEKPANYSAELFIPGLAGALVGYWLGYNVARKKMSGGYQIIVGIVAVCATAFSYLGYQSLVEIGGIPPWYDYALYPVFVLVNVALFFIFGLIGLKVPSPNDQGDAQNDEG